VAVHRLDRDGVTLCCDDIGAGSPAMVFVHGWTCNRTHWAPQVGHFRREHRVVTVDLRGHGESSAPEQPYTVAGFAEDLAWVCGQVAVEQAVLVGHSMGAAVVLETAVGSPHLARGVVLVDAAPIVAGPPIAAGAGVLEAMAGPDAAAARAAMIEHATLGFDNDPELGDRIRRDMAVTPGHVARACVRTLVEWDGEAAARECTVPILHIAADEPINDAAMLRSANPLLRTAQTFGGAHFNHLQVPDQVNAMIARFVDTLA
jgi:pimeloyl-ACP methyl ester carboxylesterase